MSKEAELLSVELKHTKNSWKRLTVEATREMTKHRSLIVKTQFPNLWGKKGR